MWLFLFMKYIPLSKGKRTMVDDEDYDYLSQFKWCYVVKKKGYPGYAMSKMGTRHNYSMHRVIMHVKEGLEIDHICGDTLDNRKSNLRIVTHRQNCLNQSTRKDNTSGHKGVWFARRDGKWAASIIVKDKSIWLGQYDLIGDALSVRKLAEAQYFGKYVRAA